MITVDAAQNGGAFGDSAATVSRAFPNNLQVGRMIVVACAIWDDGQSFGPFTSANCTQSGGTATLDTIAMAVQTSRNTGTTFDIHIGIWSALVTGAGSCTMQVGTFPMGGGSGSFSWLASTEVSTDVGWDSSRLEASNTNNGSSTNPASGNGTSADDALFFGAFTGNWSTNSGITPDGAFTNCFESEDGTAHQTGAAAYRVTTSGLTDQAEWTTVANDQWAAALAVYKEAPAPATGVPVAWLRA